MLAGAVSKQQLLERIEEVDGRDAADVRVAQRKELIPALQSKSELIVTPASKDYTIDYTIADLVNSCTAKQTLPAYNPQRAKGDESATVTIKASYVKQAFTTKESPRDTGLNLLNLENRTGMTFCDRQLDQVCVLTRIIKDHDVAPLSRRTRTGGQQPLQPSPTEGVATTHQGARSILLPRRLGRRRDLHHVY